MTELRTVDLFVEDRAHEELLRALVNRLAREAKTAVIIRPRSAQGGHGRVLKELALQQKLIQKGFAGLKQPDILVVATDTNCTSYGRSKKEVLKTLLPAFKDRTAVACPDPHN